MIHAAKSPPQEGDARALGPLRVARHGAVLAVGLDRPSKRNAINDETIEALDQCFSTLPREVGAVVLHGIGPNFSAGLDLSEIAERDVTAGVFHSRSWHRCFEKIEFGRTPVIAALKGAVIGGGLELACAAHIRVADPTTFYALPEGQRGIFVGGGASVRLPRLIGVARMADMMLTGRTYSAAEGVPLGFSQYLVGADESFAKALELANRCCGNAPLTNFSVIQALPRIADSDPRIGFFMESLMAAVAQGDIEAKNRVRDFLEKRADKVARPD
ncbi:enoyl-CoA hydratase [Rhodoblastus sphagnicola]|uniref:Enoyl-CoA hydratase n=1 Tax=Rhodoblastus sphagnicola TaxID=333368 RepID=A0A2S6N1X2_9HYPH|nr:crotonase/enoyl-CoA hydratase family protein [Rhodoblastus sphagnicola]MBB4198265.1 enoyl-CoA hydratase/carnithine racemase [Rhodoblastus sphagnicola]PPQ28613.1 enoyl-CoA hydratase [Rhodoblastus sphagnicola]